MCTLSRSGHNRVLIFVFRRDKLSLVSFLNISFLLTYPILMSPSVYHHLHIESRKWSCFPDSMHTALVSYKSRICTIVSIESIIAVSMRSVLLSCESFHTLVYFEILACPIGSLTIFHASSLRNEMLVFVSFKNLMSILSL